jgi:hypothetical protein
MKDLFGAIAQVDNTWSLAAFAISAVLLVLNRVMASPDAERRRGKKAPAALSTRVAMPIVAVIVLLGVLPMLADTYLKALDITGDDIYRVRVIALGPEGTPMAGVTLKTTVSNETTVTSQDTAVVAIPRGAVPADGRITIFGDLESAFLHGRAEVQLGDELNPAVTIPLASVRTATVTGLVQDDAGRAVAGATVTAVGGESSVTSAAGTFTVKAGAAAGQVVRLHAEKSGYAPADQNHPAGTEPVTIVLAREAN